MQTENTCVETDLGNIALNPRGEYSGEASYEYLDTVSYMGGSYVCLAELTKTISRIAPEEGKNTEHWQILTLPGGLTSDYIAMHDDVVNKAKQVETSRAAVELSQQEVEDAQADVSQMRQDTQEAAEEAASSRDSAAGYAQSAEASRTAAKESEDNINAQVTGFNAYVAEKTSAAETAITEARRVAVSAVSTKQDNVTQAVTDEGDKQMKNVEDAGTEQVGKVKSAGASAVSAAGAAGVSAVNAVKAQQTASIKAVADKGTQQVTAVNTAGSTQVSTIETKGADQVKAIKEAGENAFQNISNGVDKGLSEEGKAADAKATGEAISKLTEDLTSKADKTALAKTDRKLDALWKLNQGISYEFQTDDTEAYQKTVPSGAKMVSIKSIGGKTIVWNQMISDGVGELMSAPVNEVVYLDTKNQETSYPIPQAVLNLPGYGWSAGDAKNEVNWENKKYIQRVGKYTIDGSEIIFKENKYWVMTVTDFEKPRPSTKNAICVNFKVADTYSKEWGGIIFRTGSNGFVFTDSESKFANADEVKDYFQQNNETIYYEINEEQIIDISDIIDNTFQEPIEVEAGGTLTFRNSHGDDRIPVPSSEEYVISLAEVAK